ncbi:PfkB family carbohydrate kinase [Candidatus Nitrosotenuis chungbukensis]|uniref:PfkB family carbohydrate kinase n=1 Tax=Candidatus Nitrosotenuis chungbukensis TaxID=1353246 RepID=UPI0005B2E447|nr:PfkB family carbohydrate kinase [Candidatus Nitrosotenuis chungbukensis]
MKLGIFSHCTIDQIKIGTDSYERPGGPACYCGLAARRLGFDVELFTKFGPDFTFTTELQKNKIKFDNALSSKPTTKFTLEVKDSERNLWLENVCEKIPYSDSDADGVLVSPVFDEISKETLDKIKKNSEMTFLDPQGFLRRVDSQKKISLDRTELDLSKITAIKSDPSEVQSLTGMTGVEGALDLQKRGVEHVLYTNKRDVSLLSKNRLYSIQLPNMEIADTSGVGDIFTAAFCCTLLKERDILWAFSFAGGAAQAALESKQIGLDKVPTKGEVQTNASYYYNIMKFTDV